MIFTAEPHTLKLFEKSILNKFEIGRGSSTSDIVLNQLFIYQHKNYSNSLNTNEFLKSFSHIELSKSRKKEND